MVATQLASDQWKQRESVLHFPMPDPLFPMDRQLTEGSANIFFFFLLKNTCPFG